MATKSLGELFDTFEREAFRLETLDDYSKSGNVDAYRTFLARESQPADYNEGWVSELRSHTSKGKRVYRVHVLSRPLTPYLRFELGWGYQKNMMGGEEFFILDTTEQPNPLEGVPDFWLMDETPVVMHYDESGAFADQEVLSEDRAGEFVAYRDTAMAHSVPFPKWWAKHGGE
ncbi:hypothetical protein AR457_13760 [Streptomyces agglomeratus]|uniref:DUF6879 domain-containing protein n=1 Tax=Streptomyces agglomeratus TaxID=285458 RepID=A0A1E5P7B8_9ACTN|nr:hypothetical protein AS594_13585 [Streptomyces agglomeratus]OEJ40596.1 hypothetical protein BGK70_22890 [Streptomyces agglomeratus]OEJ45023.1 hypothetical protein AR457_13760 [Streptomyces agglomeratus]OEJ55870.1 hypothetical protein BGK72_22520 [Streptomyces agglomeratus]OEJ60481.1 hypothetical protein BGM19_23225 [Streptomyces agglomeratus]